MVSIEVRNLSFRYGSYPVLQGISHTFLPGTFTVIMGKNGSGKTTMLRCILQQLKNYKGDIFVNEKTARFYTPETLAQKIALVPQGHEFIFGATVFESILLGRLPFMTWAPSDSDFQMVDKVIERLNLNHLAAKNIREISGGERQKVFIARAIAQNTPVIVFDEPITYLDMKHQVEILGILKNLTEVGYNVIMVGHDLNLSLQFGDDFLFLKDGKSYYIRDKEKITTSLVEDIFDIKMIKLEKGSHVYFFPS